MSPTPKLESTTTINSTQHPISYEELRKKFIEFWPELLTDISKDPELKVMPTTLKWVQTVMQRNVTQGKQNRALACLSTYYNLGVDETLQENSNLLMAIGWCIEIMQAAGLIADDIMDQSETRRGVKCWYKETDVGSTALNDVLLLENLTYHLVYKYFGDKSYFGKLLAHIHSTTMKTVMGQSMDTRFAIDFDLDNFTMEAYNQIVTFKTSYYTFYSPVATAMIMASITEDSIYDAVRDVTLQMGYLFQVQDDYLDCFGDPKVTGKIGTDISDGKCTWLIVKALEIASGEQRRVLETCYGKKSVENLRTVKKIYNELDIEDHYMRFETETYAQLKELVKRLPERLPKASFHELLNKIYKRVK